MSIDKWDECFIGINSIEMNFEDLSRRSFASLTSSYLCLHEVAFSLQGKLNRVCLCSILHLFLFTLFLILFLILFIHYKTTFYLYITKPSSTLFEISKPSSIIFKLCIFFTAFYLDSIYFLQIHRPLASYITWYSCSAAASLGINVHYNLRPRTPGSNFDGQNWPVRHSFPQPRRLSDMSSNNLFWFPLFLRQYGSLLSISGLVSPLWSFPRLFVLHF